MTEDEVEIIDVIVIKKEHNIFIACSDVTQVVSQGKTEKEAVINLFEAKELYKDTITDSLMMAKMSELEDDKDE